MGENTIRKPCQAMKLSMCKTAPPQVGIRILKKGSDRISVLWREELRNCANNKPASWEDQGVRVCYPC